MNNAPLNHENNICSSSPLFLVAILMLSLVACKKRSTEDEKVFTKTDFPMAVGDWWQYQQTDINGPKDTLLVSIVAQTRHDDTTDFTCTIYKNYYHRIVDTGHYLIYTTGLHYYGANPNYSYLGEVYLQFPFTVGQKWNSVSGADTITAVGWGASISLLSRTFGPIYSLTLDGSERGLRTNLQNTVVAPGVGIVDHSIDIETPTTVPQKQSLLLLDYHVQ